MIKRVFYGHHLQSSYHGWPNHVTPDKGIGVFKTVMNFEFCQDAKRANPDIITVCRQMIDHQQPYLDKAGESWEKALGAAAEFIDVFKDAVVRLDQWVDYWESLNETYSANPETLRKAIAFDRAFIAVWDDSIYWGAADANQYATNSYLFAMKVKVPLGTVPRGRPAVFTAAVGNPGARAELIIDREGNPLAVISDTAPCAPDESQYIDLLPLAEDAETHDAAMCYHTYWPVYNKRSYIGDTDVAFDLHLRWEVMDNFFTQAGADVHVKWLPTEAGAVGCGDPDTWDDWGYQLNAGAGWRHHRVWDWDLSGYISDLDTYRQMLINTDAYQEGRYLGYTLFTYDPWGWEWFKLDQHDWEALSQHASEQPPLPDPSPPPPPPPSDCADCPGVPPFEFTRVYLLLPQDAPLQTLIDTARWYYKYRNTIGFSPEEAGMGYLKKKRVIAIAWPEDRREWLRWYMEEMYPGEVDLAFKPKPPGVD